MYSRQTGSGIYKILNQDLFFVPSFCLLYFVHHRNAFVVLVMVVHFVLTDVKKQDVKVLGILLN